MYFWNSMCRRFLSKWYFASFTTIYVSKSKILIHNKIHFFNSSPKSQRSEHGLIYTVYFQLNCQRWDSWFKAWRLESNRWIRPLELLSGSPLLQNWKFSLRWSLCKIILIYYNAQLKIKRVPSPGVYFLKTNVSKAW